MIVCCLLNRISIFLCFGSADFIYLILLIQSSHDHKMIGFWFGLNDGR